MCPFIELKLHLHPSICINSFLSSVFFFFLNKNQSIKRKHFKAWECLTCDFERIVGWYFRRIFRGQHTQRILTNALQTEWQQQKLMSMRKWNMNLCVCVCVVCSINLVCLCWGHNFSACFFIQSEYKMQNICRCRYVGIFRNQIKRLYYHHISLIRCIKSISHFCVTE